MNDVNLYSPGLRLAAAGGQPVGLRSAQTAKADTSTVNPQASEKAQMVRSEARPEELEGAVTKLNDYVQNVQRDLQFEVDMERGQTIVRVVDNETQEVIRQIPDEVALRLADNLQQDEPLTLFNIKV